MLTGVTSLTTMEALMVALSGLAMVFIVLGCLALLIVVNAKVVQSIESKKKPAPAPAAKAAPTPAPVVPAQDDQELVAVLMAAIAAETESDPGSFRITNIQQR